jgi:hypothetical protein
VSRDGTVVVGFERVGGWIDLDGQWDVVRLVASVLREVRVRSVISVLREVWLRRVITCGIYWDEQGLTFGQGKFGARRVKIARLSECFRRA